MCIFNVNLQGSFGSEHLFTKVTSMYGVGQHEQCVYYECDTWMEPLTPSTGGLHICSSESICIAYQVHTKVYSSESICITNQMHTKVYSSESIPYDTTPTHSSDCKILCSVLWWVKNFIYVAFIHTRHEPSSIRLLSPTPSLCKELIKTPFTE